MLKSIFSLFKDGKPSKIEPESTDSMCLISQQQSQKSLNYDQIKLKYDELTPLQKELLFKIYLDFSCAPFTRDGKLTDLILDKMQLNDYELLRKKGFLTRFKNTGREVISAPYVNVLYRELEKIRHESQNSL